MPVRQAKATRCEAKAVRLRRARLARIAPSLLRTHARHIVSALEAASIGRVRRLLELGRHWLQLTAADVV